MRRNLDRMIDLSVVDDLLELWRRLWRISLCIVSCTFLSHLLLLGTLFTCPGCYYVSRSIEVSVIKGECIGFVDLRLSCTTFLRQSKRQARFPANMNPLLSCLLILCMILVGLCVVYFAHKLCLPTVCIRVYIDEALVSTIWCDNISLSLIRSPKDDSLVLKTTLDSAAQCSIMDVFLHNIELLVSIETLAIARFLHSSVLSVLRESNYDHPKLSKRVPVDVYTSLRIGEVVLNIPQSTATPSSLFLLVLHAKEHPAAIASFPYYLGIWNHVASVFRRGGAVRMTVGVCVDIAEVDVQGKIKVILRHVAWPAKTMWDFDEIDGCGVVRAEVLVQDVYCKVLEASKYHRKVCGSRKNDNPGSDEDTEFPTTNEAEYPCSTSSIPIDVDDRKGFSYLPLLLLDSPLSSTYPV